MRSTGAYVLILALAVTGCTSGDDDPEGGPTTAGPPAPNATGEFSGIPDVVSAVEPSVVTIVTASGLGSGVVYDTGGVIVTNYHVVAGGDDVVIALADGSRIDGTVLASDQVTDLAVVQAQREDLPAATFQPQLPRVGEAVIALGSPLGLENSVTAGIVSGLSREIPGSAAQSRALVDLIQTDAAISPGNSGGALVNLNGEVVGVSEAYIPPQAGAVSLGFAIPAATVVDIVGQLLEDGTASHAAIGIVPGRLTPQIAGALGLDTDEGVLVLDVVGGGSAAEAGIQRGDIITAIAGDAVPTVEDFLAALRDLNPGDEVDVEINRLGRTSTKSVTLGTLGS